MPQKHHDFEVDYKAVCRANHNLRIDIDRLSETVTAYRAKVTELRQENANLRDNIRRLEKNAARRLVSRKE
jgi:cell division protein FtsB